MSRDDNLSQADTLRITVVNKTETIDFRIDRYTFLDDESEDEAEDESEDEAEDESEDDNELHITIVEKHIHASHHSTVYLGKAGDVSLVVKMCHELKFSKDISNEAQVYETMLSGIQGTVVPKFYGYFKGRDHKKCRVSCLVLEYCGDSLGMSFDDLETTDKIKIMTALGKLHQHGYHHGDFKERNVVSHNGEYKLIDFHNIYSHKCCWRDGMDWRTDELHHRVRLGAPCPVLFVAATDMQLWKYTDNPMIRICGKKLNGTEYPPQEIIDKLTSGWYHNYHANTDVLLDWLTKVKKEMDENNGDLDIETQIANRPTLPIDPRHGRYDFHFRLEAAC